MDKTVYVSVINETSIPVHDFAFGDLCVSVNDNARMDVPVEMARAMRSQYPFLRIEGDMSRVVVPQPPVAPVAASEPVEVKEEPKVEEEIAPSFASEEADLDEFVDHSGPKPTVACPKCGKICKKGTGIAVHLRNGHPDFLTE